MFQLTRKSMLSGREHTLTIPMTEEAFARAAQKWQAGTLLQDAFPNLPASMREFIKTGITSEEWDTLG